MKLDWTVHIELFYHKYFFSVCCFIFNKSNDCDLFCKFFA